MAEEIKKETIEDVKVDDKDTKTTNTTDESVKTHEDDKKDKTFTQAELDEILAKRLERERKKYADYDDLKSKVDEFSKAEDERKKAEMSEIERIQLEKEEAEKRVKEFEEKANQSLSEANKRLMKAEFKLIAKEIGVRQDALEDAFVLTDLDGVEINEDGEVTGVKEALETLKEKKSYLFETKKEYADPSTGNRQPNRDSKESQQKKLGELQERARKTGRMEDKIAYVRYKKEIGL